MVVKRATKEAKQSQGLLTVVPWNYDLLLQLWLWLAMPHAWPSI